MTQCAWAASKTKNTYLSAKYYSLVGRRGKKRALIAVGHKILIMVYYILKTGMPYKELGKDYLSRRREDKIVKGHLKRLKDLGYEVSICHSRDKVDPFCIFKGTRRELPVSRYS